MTAPQFGDPRLPARFWAKVTVGPSPARRPELGPCWLWNRPTAAHGGYGQFWIGHTSTGAHRHAYLTLVGPTPLTLDHLCRVRSCVNPAHLEPTSIGENVLRSPLAIPSINAAKTHCPRRHPYDTANTYLDKLGGRSCRACARERLRTLYVSRRAARLAAAA